MKIIKTSHYQIYSIKKSKNLYIKLFNPCTNTWLPGKSSGTNKVAEAEKIAMSWLLEEPESKSENVILQLENKIKIFYIKSNFHETDFKRRN